MQTHRLVVGVWDHTSRKQCIGALSFSLAELATAPDAASTPAWFVLMDPERGAAQHFRSREIAMPAALRVPAASADVARQRSGSVAKAAAKAGSVAAALAVLALLGRGSFGKVVLARADKQVCSGCCWCELSGILSTAFLFPTAVRGQDHLEAGRVGQRRRRDSSGRGPFA